MSCQPHRVTSGLSNSGHKQIHISKLFSHILYIKPLSSQSTKPITSHACCVHKSWDTCLTKQNPSCSWAAEQYWIKLYNSANELIAHASGDTYLVKQNPSWSWAVLNKVIQFSEWINRTCIWRGGKCDHLKHSLDSSCYFICSQNDCWSQWCLKNGHSWYKMRKMSTQIIHEKVIANVLYTCIIMIMFYHFVLNVAVLAETQVCDTNSSGNVACRKTNRSWISAHRKAYWNKIFMALGHSWV